MKLTGKWKLQREQRERERDREGEREIERGGERERGERETETEIIFHWRATHWIFSETTHSMFFQHPYKAAIFCNIVI